MDRTRVSNQIISYMTPMKWSGASSTSGAPIGLYDDYTGSGQWTRTPIPASCVMQTTTDVVIPQFRRKVANGQVFFNPLNSVHVEEQVTSQGSLEYYSYVDGLSRWYYHYKMLDAPFMAGISYGTYSFPARLVLSASTLDSCLTNAISQTSVNSANALETFAELGESVASLRSVFTKAYRLCKNFRSFALQGYQSIDYALKAAFQPHSESRAIAVRDAWLELRYGIRPLVYDILNWISAFEDIMTTTRFRGTASAYTEGPVATSSSYYGGSNSTTGFLLKQVTSSHIECHTGCLAQLDLASVNMLSSRLGANRILQTAWELIPYSFVVDWFFNVGNTIDSWVPQPGVTTLGTWRTTCEYRSYRVATIGYYPAANITNVVSTPTYTHSVTERRIVRVGNPAAPVLPSLSIRLSISKLADLLGLFSQLNK